MAMTENNNRSMPADPVARWKSAISEDVRRAVSSMLTGDRAKDVAGRVMIALEQARTTAPDIINCSPDSVKRALALMILTDTRPGGASPKLYLIPRRNRDVWELNAWFSHRALIDFAFRAGWIVSTALVSVEDSLIVEDGEVRHVVTDPDNPPTKYEDLRGVVVYAWPKGDRASKVSRYVPKDTIDARRAVSDSAKGKFSPWHNWPVEMAEKTAIKYVVSRGLFPVDDAADYTSDAGEPVVGPFAPMQAPQPAPAALNAPAQTGSGLDGLAAVVGASGDAGEPEGKEPVILTVPTEPEPVKVPRKGAPSEASST
ncbi:MAG TPA: recombinase RecT [Myxococcota bacterium]|nr:recombinase RecT [Myxococcota bacterium]